MRPINLLPPESFEKARTRRRILQIALAALAYVVLLALVTIWWQGRVDRAEDDVVAQQEINAGLQAQVAALAEARELVVDYEANAALVATALANDVSWGRILNDLGRMIPERVWLNSFSGSAQALGPGVQGSLQVSGTGFDFPDVSAWLRSLDSDRFPSVSGTWVTNAATAAIGEAEVVEFSSSTSLTDAALTDRLEERIPEVSP